MIKTLSFRFELLAFLLSYGQWHRARHEPRPCWRQLKARYNLARRRHNGQGEAWANLNRATNEALRRELGWNR